MTARIATAAALMSAIAPAMDADVLNLHSSPESLKRAIERLSIPGAGEPDHNVGACAGCGRLGAGGRCGTCVQGPAGIPMSPGGAAAARTLLGWLGGSGILARLKALGIAPPNMDVASAAQSVDVEPACIPYEDAIKDCLMMDTLVSAVVAADASGNATISVSAAQGWFFAFYFDIQVVRPGATIADDVCIPECQYTMTQPLVDGCPPPPCQPGGNIARNAAFYVRRDTASGCGRPFQAVIPSTSQGAPITVNVSRLVTGDRVQVQYRGFCFDTRVCC